MWIPAWIVVLCIVVALLPSWDSAELVHCPNCGKQWEPGFHVDGSYCLCDECEAKI